jgi:biopolymer transport protein ExbD
MKLRVTQSEEDAVVMMAPLIDCVFILLIFFLVTSLLTKPHKELGVKMPDSGAADTAVEQAEPVVIEVTGIDPDAGGPGVAKRTGKAKSDPFIFLNGDLMTRDLLERRLGQVAKETPNRHVRIDTEGQMAWRYIVPIIDLCRFHNLVNVAVRIK